MRQLLRNDTKFTWTDKCTAELELLKVALTFNPIMKPLQPNRPVYLTVVAGMDRIGSMLWQLDNDNIPHVCALSVNGHDSESKEMATLTTGNVWSRYVSASLREILVR